MSNFFSQFSRHLNDPESNHRKIATSFLWISLFVFIGKLAGAAKEMVVAWRYGISETVDAYVLIFNLINWPVAVWFSMLTVLFLPLAARLKHDCPNELTRFRGELLALTLVIGMLLGLISWFGLPGLLRSGWIELSDTVLTEALRMATGLALLAPLGFLISYLSVLMLACGRQRNTLFEAISAMTILTALLLPHQWIPEPLIWGTVAGYLLQLVALSFSLHRMGESQIPKFAFVSPIWRGFWGSIGIVAAAQLLMSFITIIDQFFAAELGPGGLSTLNYANRILMLMLGAGAMVISRATLPIFSDISAKSADILYSITLHWAKLMFGLGLLVVVIGWFAAPGVVGLLFERGMFTADETFIVSETLRLAMLQIPFYFSSLVLVAYYTANRFYYMLLFLAGGSLVIKLVATWLLAGQLGLHGVVLSTAFVYLINLIVMIASLGKMK